MPPDEFLHDRKDFEDLVRAVAQEQKINDPALVEKDYWIMHVLYGLQLLELTFQLKGGTSLSKGFNVIHRFSEDVDIQIEPFDDIPVDTNPNHDKEAQVESRRQFFQRLTEKLKIAGIDSVERDTAFDDPRLRSAGVRLLYKSKFGALDGLKEGILLEAGFDKTAPNERVTISSWAFDFASRSKLDVIDNRAKEVPCYNPEYTFVEKLQTITKKFRQFKEKGDLAPNFLRHYYDVHQLLELDRVQRFIGTDEYKKHKATRFKSENQNLKETDAFTLSDKKVRDQFEAEYKRRSALYFKGQVPLTDILKRIGMDLDRL